MSSLDPKSLVSSSTRDGGVLPSVFPLSSSTDKEEPDVIVLDIGSGSIKAGWAGEDAPRIVIPTLLLDHHGQAMPASVMMDQHHMERNEYAVGHAALQVRIIQSTQPTPMQTRGAHQQQPTQSTMNTARTRIVHHSAH